MKYQIMWNLLYRKIRYKRKYKLKKNYTILGLKESDIACMD